METHAARKTRGVCVGRQINGGVCMLGGMINECAPCCHLYFGIQSKAQFSVKYDAGPLR